MTLRSTKLVLKRQYLTGESERKQQRRGQKRKLTYCGKEIVNDDETRRKNREAAKKSRKKRKLMQQKRAEEFTELKEMNKSLVDTVKKQQVENMVLRKQIAKLTKKVANMEKREEERELKSSASNPQVY